ncbi:hypothetical protein GCM10023063_44750 [Arthrobacter methylotrophus]|uniref:hypothetical protein n=1 Tax=Arthrobacter methylotrophus TaxID=121291 RepID=UPI0031EB98CB
MFEDRKLYLSPVMDLFDRQIISYSIGSSPNLELTNAFLLSQSNFRGPVHQVKERSETGCRM